jgi:UDP-glucose 4-epimerase
VGDLGRANWSTALCGVDAVVHLAARVHVMSELSPDALRQYRDANVLGTVQLAKAAADAGVRRFLYVSSIKVNGEATIPGKPFTVNDLPEPKDPYGVSKLEAEMALRDLVAGTNMELVIIRPVMIYGPNVKANFLNMMRWIRRGIPLPLASVQNRRSLVFLDNLVDLISVCLHHPSAAENTFLVSDGEDLSTPDLLRRTAKAMGGNARLFPVPPRFLQRVSELIGRADLVNRLCGSLQVDISRTREVLGWSPPVSLDEGLRRTVESFMVATDT